MSSKGKILVVDDDRLVLATVVHGLGRAGFEVVDADNGDDAILLARQHRPDLALLDIRMEGLSGFDVAHYLRDSLGTPFLFLSAFADAQTLQRVRELGALAYLNKPLDIDQLVPMVEDVMAGVLSRGPAAEAPAAAAAPVPRHGPALQPAGAGPAAPSGGPRPASARPAAGEELADLVPVAVGVLMHRYSLDRHEALRRLRGLAAADGRSLAAQAQALVDAVELLARPGTL